MKMKNIYSFLIFLICVVPSNIFAQNLSYKEFLDLQKKNHAEIATYIEGKSGWNFSENGISEDFHSYNFKKWQHTIQYYYGDDETDATFTIFSLNGYENALLYIMPSDNFYDMLNNVKNDKHWIYNKNVKEDGILSKFFTFKDYNLVLSNNDDQTFFSMLLYNKSDILKLEKIEYDKEVERKKLDSIAKEEKNRIEKKYQAIISKADSLLMVHNLKDSKEQYLEALNIKPNESYPTSRINEINSTSLFLEERKSSVYDYKEINPTKYSEIYNSLLSDIIEKFSSDNSNGIVKIELIYKIDTSGKTDLEYSKIAIGNQEMINKIITAAKNHKLLDAYKKHYMVNAKANYNIEVKLFNIEYKVKKTYVKTKIKNYPTNLYLNEINNLIASGPIGKYTISIQDKKVNSIDFSRNRITKYKGIGGPSNMLLSLLVPGLGVKNVTGGRKTGLGRTISTYLLIGAGIGCKFWSLSEYDKYHSSITQTDMDKYYTKANILNKAFYIACATGAAVWLFDIIWVGCKGAKNRKEQSYYRKTFSFNYEPINHSVSLNYRLKF